MTQVDLRRPRLGVNRLGIDPANVQGVKEIAANVDTTLAQRGGQNAGHAVHPTSDPQQAIAAVVDSIEAGHHRQQHLGSTDVGGRLLAADMLLAGLQC